MLWEEAEPQVAVVGVGHGFLNPATEAYLISGYHYH